MIVGKTSRIQPLKKPRTGEKSAEKKKVFFSLARRPVGEPAGPTRKGTGARPMRAHDSRCPPRPKHAGMGTGGCAQVAQQIFSPLFFLFVRWSTGDSVHLLHNETTASVPCTIQWLRTDHGKIGWSRGQCSMIWTDLA